MIFSELPNAISSAKAQLYDSIRSNYAQFQVVKRIYTIIHVCDHLFLRYRNTNFMTTMHYQNARSSVSAADQELKSLHVAVSFAPY